MNKLKMLALLAGAFLWGSASAAVVCDSCDYNQGQVASNLGLHNTIAEDNSTYSNATTGTNGVFLNYWVFSIAPAGSASVNAIFLPINNISNFDVQLFDVDSSTCAANTPTSAGICTALDLGAMIADGFTNPAFATVIDFTDLDAGTYAFSISGTISGLGPTQPASYTGNLQVNQAVPEPGSLALAGLSLLGLAMVQRRRKS